MAINLEIAFHKQPAPKKRKVVIHKDIVDRYNKYKDRRDKDSKSFNELLQLTENKELPLLKEDHILVKM